VSAPDTDPWAVFIAGVTGVPVLERAETREGTGCAIFWSMAAMAVSIPATCFCCSAWRPAPFWVDVPFKPTRSPIFTVTKTPFSALRNAGRSTHATAVSPEVGTLPEKSMENVCSFPSRFPCASRPGTPDQFPPPAGNGKIETCQMTDRTRGSMLSQVNRPLWSPALVSMNPVVPSAYTRVVWNAPGGQTPVALPTWPGQSHACTAVDLPN